MPYASARVTAAQQRERRVVAGGVLIVVVALAVTWIGLPFAREWSRREAAIAALRIDADSLAGLVAARASIEARATSEEAALSASGRRVFHARSLTLAASALQSLLTDAADASHWVVTRLDVAQGDDQTAGRSAEQPGDGADDESGDGSVDASVDGRTSDATSAPRSTPRTRSLPATLVGYCDVIGLAALLDQLARAPRVVHVERMSVQQNSALRGAADMLQVTLTLRAPVVIE